MLMWVQNIQFNEVKCSKYIILKGLVFVTNAKHFQLKSGFITNSENLKNENFIFIHIFSINYKSIHRKTTYEVSNEQNLFEYIIKFKSNKHCTIQNTDQ